MLKAFKLLRSIVASVGIIWIALQALGSGADPTIIGTAAIVTLGLYNGIEIADYKALAQAIVEISNENQGE